MAAGARLARDRLRVRLDADDVAVQQLGSVDARAMAGALDVDVVAALEITHAPVAAQRLDHAVLAADELPGIGSEDDVVVRLAADAHGVAAQREPAHLASIRGNDRERGSDRSHGRSCVVVGCRHVRADASARRRSSALPRRPEHDPVRSARRADGLGGAAATT